MSYEPKFLKCFAHSKYTLNVKWRDLEGFGSFKNCKRFVYKYWAWIRNEVMVQKWCHATLHNDTQQYDTRSCVLVSI